MSTPTRALVLGGGGATGNAWLIGVLAGLLDAGVDVTAPDLTVGTSAGATAAAQLAGKTATELYGDIVGTEPPPVRPAVPTADHLAWLRELISTATDAADMRRRVGAAARGREAASDGSWQENWRSTVAARLTRHDWPDRALAVPAVDAEDGEPHVFRRHSGVDLVDAVAASCSSGLPFRIGGRPFIDGGYRRNENADLAAGYARILVLSPLGGRTLHPMAWRLQLAAQVEELRAGGSRVLVVVPAAEAEHLFGAKAMDLSLRPASARAGFDQGRGLAEEVSRLLVG